MDDAVRFDELCHSYLMHYGTPGMHWYKQGEGKRYQSQAAYAQGRPNPDAKTRGERDSGKQRMKLRNKPFDDDVSDYGMAKYPKQRLSDLHTFNGVPTYESRLQLNHPSGENYDGPGRHYNCPNCAAAFELHERGYDVIARTARNGSNVGEIEKMYTGASLRRVADRSDIPKLQRLWNDRTKTFNGTDKYNKELERQQAITAGNTIKAISSQGNGARGTIVIGWADDPSFSKRTTFYHAFNYKNENGDVKFYDVQSGKKDNLIGMAGRGNKVMNEIMQQGVDPREVYLMRTDNLQPTERIMTAVYSPDRSIKHSYLCHSKFIPKIQNGKKRSRLMTPNEAYELVCKFLKEKRAVAMCRNYDDYFAFFMLPPGTKKGEPVFVGREMILVDKKSKKVFWEDDDENVDLRRKFWRPVSDKDLGLDALAHSYLG